MSALEQTNGTVPDADGLRVPLAEVQKELLQYCVGGAEGLQANAEGAILPGQLEVVESASGQTDTGRPVVLACGIVAAGFLGLGTILALTLPHQAPLALLCFGATAVAILLIGWLTAASSRASARRVTASVSTATLARVHVRLGDEQTYGVAKDARLHGIGSVLGWPDARWLGLEVIAHVAESPATRTRRLLSWEAAPIQPTPATARSDVEFAAGGLNRYRLTHDGQRDLFQHIRHGAVVAELPLPTLGIAELNLRTDGRPWDLRLRFSSGEKFVIRKSRGVDLLRELVARRPDLPRTTSHVSFE